MQDPGVRIIFEIRAQALFDETLSKCFIQHRKCHFDAPEKIAIHPVSAGEKYPVIAVIEEIENPAVLKKPPDDGTHPNMLREAGNAGP